MTLRPSSVWHSAVDPDACTCKFRDPWRCAVKQGLPTVTCPCRCHRPEYLKRPGDLDAKPGDLISMPKDTHTPQQIIDYMESLLSSRREITGDELLADTLFVFNPNAAPDSSAIDHPAHYNQGGIECIDALEAALSPLEFQGFCRANALKYLWRGPHKGKSVEDYRKAMWYTERLIASVRKRESTTSIVAESTPGAKT